MYNSLKEKYEVTAEEAVDEAKRLMDRNVVYGRMDYANAQSISLQLQQAQSNIQKLMGILEAESHGPN